MQIPIACEIFRENVKTNPLSYLLLAVLGSGLGMLVGDSFKIGLIRGLLIET
jgi:hypothetical protein